MATALADLRGRGVLVTGASRGLGAHIAQALAREGANLALVARSADGLAETAAAVRALGVKATVITADLGSAAERERLVAAASEALGTIDVLVNNAGVESEGPFLDLDAKAIAHTVEVNVTAPVHLARLVLPGMLERRRGHVVSMASLAGKKGIAYDALYCGTKAALIEWSDGVRGELYGTGVSSSVVCPGYVTGEGMFARFGVKPPGLLGSCTPEQVARAVVQAVKRDRAQILVNSKPVRPLLAIYGLFPNFGGTMVRWLGIVAFQRRKVEALRRVQSDPRALRLTGGDGR